MQLFSTIFNNVYYYKRVLYWHTGARFNALRSISHKLELFSWWIRTWASKFVWLYKCCRRLCHNFCNDGADWLSWTVFCNRGTRCALNQGPTAQLQIPRRQCAHHRRHRPLQFFCFLCAWFYRAVTLRLFFCLFLCFCHRAVIFWVNW